MKSKDVFGFVERFLRKVFYQYGFFIARHPHLFIILPVILTLILGGLAGYFLLSGQVVEESRAWYLYSPVDAPSHQEHAVANEFFFEEGLADQELFLIKFGMMAKDEGTLLRPKYLDAIIQTMQYVKSNLTIYHEGMPYTYKDLCGTTCDECELFRIFKEIYENPDTRNHPNFKLSYPMMNLNGNPYYMGDILAGATLSEASGRIDDLKAVVLPFRAARNTKLNSLLLEMWELEVNRFVGGFQHPLINASALSDGIVSFEVRRNGMSSSEYFRLSVAVIFLFVVLTSASRDPIKTKLWEGFAGVIGPILSIVIVFGALFSFGYPFVAITMVTPFLILSIGVDDCFLLLNAWRKTGSKLSVPERMAQTLAEAGPGITLTSLTNAVSFGVGVISPTPAIVYFCTFTALGVTIDFIIQITFFAGVLVLGGRREASGRNGYLICCPYRSIKITPLKTRKSSNYDLRRSEDTRFVTRSSVVWARFITNKFSRAIVFGLLLTYWGIAAYGMSNLRVEMKSQKTVASDSPVLGMLGIVDRYVWKKGTQAYVFVNNPPDFRDRRQRDRFLRMVDELHSLPNSMGPDSTVLWLYKFLTDFRLYRPKSINDFYKILPKWLEDIPRWQYFVKLNDSSIGAHDENSDINDILEIIKKIHRYNEDPDSIDFQELQKHSFNKAQGVIEDDGFAPENDEFVIGSSRSQEPFPGERSRRSKNEHPPNLRSFMFSSGFTDIQIFSDRATLTQSWRNLTATYPEFNATVYQINSFYADQQLSIKRTTMNTLLIAMVIMIIICIAFIPNAVSVLSATVSMVSICFGVLGILALWGVDLDPISMASILMSVGFSVDFTCHISYHYYKSTNDSHRDGAETQMSGTISGRCSSASSSGPSSTNSDQSQKCCYTICYSESSSEKPNIPVAIPEIPQKDSTVFTPEDRLVEALKVVGWPMVQVGVSTLAGVSMLAIQNTYMMNVFVKTVILVVSLGLAHGLIILPVILTSASHFMLWLESFRK